MSRVVVLAFLAAAAAVALAPKTLAQPGTPGQINDPSTYRGSMANQEAERASSAAAEAQNQQMLQRMDQNYAGYAGGRRGGGGGGSGGPPPLKSHPLLPAAKNPLLGMWRMGQTKSLNLSAIPMFPGTQEIVDAAMGGGCASVLGKPDTVIRFTPTQLNWVAPDGHDEILNHVEYRSDGANVIVIPSDGDLALIFGMTNKDNAVVALLNCTLSRTSTSARLGQTASGGAASGGVAIAAGQAILNFTVGEVVNGQLSAPPAGTRLFLTSQNPDANLVKAGFTTAATPIEALFDACRLNQGGTQERCNQGMQALTSGTIGAVATDSNGRAVTGAVAPGRYYVVGFTPYKGHSLIWHMPVDLRAGANAVSLTPQNGSVSH